MRMMDNVQAVQRPRLQAVVRKETGRPCANVPSVWLWDLVEYLSYDRVAVHYRHQNDIFVVYFEQSSAVTAQRILDDWANSSPEASPNR